MSSQTCQINPFEIKVDSEELMKTLNSIDSCDLRTRFKNTQDPITLAFRTFDNAPLGDLAKDFLKDTIFDIVSFVTKICK